MKTPRPYQQQAIDRGVNSNLLIADQMGLGKSLVAIEVCKAVFNHCNAPALIVCPKTIRDQWASFIWDQDPNSTILIIQTLDDVRICKPYDYCIIHYEALVKLHPQLARYQFSTIVVDEAHRIKNHGTRSKPIARTRAVKALKAYRRLALTGTPYDKNPSELWSILHYLEKDAFSSYWRFIQEHIDFDTMYYGQTEVKQNFRLRDPKHFARVIAPYVIQRKKRDVLPELPPIQVTHIPIELAPDQRKAYNKIDEIIRGEIEFAELDDPIIIANILTKFTRLLQLACDPELLDISASSAKLAWLGDWLQDNPNTPVLIFTRYRRVAEKVAAAMLDSTLLIGGSKRSAFPVKPQRIVATIAAAGEGLDLGHIDTAIYLDCDWSSILMQQSMERIDRGTNTEPKQVIFLEASNTIDQLIRKALDSKLSTKEIIERFLRNVHIHHHV